MGMKSMEEEAPPLSDEREGTLSRQPNASVVCTRLGASGAASPIGGGISRSSDASSCRTVLRLAAAA